MKWRNNMNINTGTISYIITTRGYLKPDLDF